jgi:hypothetical protein
VRVVRSRSLTKDIHLSIHLQLVAVAALHEAELEDAAKVARDMQSKLRTQALSADHALEDHAAELAKMRGELRTKSAAVTAAESEREAVMHELGTKVDAGQAAEASQLRVQLTTEQARSSDFEFKQGQLEEEVRAQVNLLALAKTEFEAMVEDLTRTIAEKERAAEIILTDTRAEFAGKLEVAEATATELQLRSEGQEATITEMQAAMANVTAAHAQAVVLHDEATTRSVSKLEEVARKHKSESEGRRASELRAVEMESAARSSTAKLENSRHKSELASTESQRTIASLKQANVELGAAKAEAISRYETTVADLTGQLELETVEHELRVAEFEQRLAGANEDVDERIATLKEQAAEYIEAVANADARKAELEAQVELLQEANDNHVAESTACVPCPLGCLPPRLQK